MSKKKFKKGLESLFGDWGGEPIEDVILELERSEEASLPEIQKPTPHSKKDIDKKANAGKNFSDDLDMLFQEVMHESIEAQIEKRKKDKADNKATPKKTKKKRKVIPRSGGIDSLIRSTVEGSIIDIQTEKNTKRVSFVFDKEKLKKLKSIAKVKKSYLKDVIDEVVQQYLEVYESENGKVDNQE
ncbi:MAG: hypothetical protein AAF573_21270 [Bacteroidota bacterium]